MLNRSEITATIAILADRVLQRDHGVPQAVTRDDWETVWHEVVNPDYEEDFYPADVLTALCECGWAFIDGPSVNYDIHLTTEAPEDGVFTLHVVWPKEKLEFVVTYLASGEIPWDSWEKAMLKNNVSCDQEGELLRRLDADDFFSFPF